MTHRHGTILVVALLASMVFLSGCGDDSAAYEDEILNYETPISSKVSNKKKNNDLDLGADESSNFHFRRIGALVPWDPYPFYDYFLKPVPIQIPVAPDVSLIDYIHPFYAYASIFTGLDRDDD